MANGRWQTVDNSTQADLGLGLLMHILDGIGGEIVERGEGRELGVASGGWDAWIQVSHPKETNPPALPTDK